MPTLGSLIAADAAGLQLRFVRPEYVARHADTAVASVIILAQEDLDAITGFSDISDALVVVEVVHSPTERTVSDIARTLTYVAERGAAGLALTEPEALEPGWRVSLPDLADRLGVPLLVTAAPMARWDTFKKEVSDRLRVEYAERQVALLDGLLVQLPQRFADPRAAEHIVQWLSTALQARVRLIPPDRPEITAAPEDPATSVVGERSESADDATHQAVHRRLVPLSRGSGEEGVLELISPVPFDVAAPRLIQHAAKVLDLVGQAAEEHHLAVKARREAGATAFQLLMIGQIVAAARVDRFRPGLLDTERVRLHVIACGPEDGVVEHGGAGHRCDGQPGAASGRCEDAADRRSRTMSLCEEAVAGRALVTECPGDPTHVLVVEPEPQAADGLRPGPSAVVSALREVVVPLPGHLMGGSRWYPVGRTEAAYNEAYEALASAPYAPDGVMIRNAVKGQALLDRLDSSAALAWALDFLAPIWRHDRLRHTVKVALSRPSQDEAAGILQVHRNTVINRLSEAGSLLPGDLEALPYQVCLLLAFDAVPDGIGEDKPVPEGHAAPALGRLLATREAREWAESHLQPLLNDEQLLETATVWLESGMVATVAAQRLPRTAARPMPVHPQTVRNRIRAIEDRLGRKLPAFAGGVKDLALALYILRGRPDLGAAGLSPLTGHLT